MDGSSLCPASRVCRQQLHTHSQNVTNRVQILGRQTLDAIILSGRERKKARRLLSEDWKINKELKAVLRCVI
jgi:hypothetical protein